MARPQKDGMDYFPHDTDASNDEKVEALRILYGNDGYAFYFILLERIYRSKDFELDVSDAETTQILGRKVEVTPQVFDKILKTALKWGCFDREEYETRGVLTSNGIKKRANVVIEKRDTMRVKYHKTVSDAETTQEPSRNPAETPQSKVKERKEEESKEKEIKEVIPYADIITFLNTETSSQYRPSSSKTKDLIKARWNEGFRFDDFKEVIAKKVASWSNDPNMVKFLRPETLFGPKFEGYLNEKVSSGQTKPRNRSAQDDITEQWLAMHEEAENNE